MTSNCIRGCATHGHHQPTCTCTPECPDHKTHCAGCAPAPTDTGYLCARCTNRIRAALRELPELTTHAASRTDGKLSPARAQTDTTRRGTPTPQSPSLAWDTAEEVIQWAHRMALACADTNNHHGPFAYRNDGVPANTLTTTLTYIRTHLHWYATVIPEDIYDETTTWQRRLEHATGMDRLVHRIKKPCPTCGQRTLVREDGAGSVTCRNRDCGRIWREGEYDWMAHVAAS